LDTVQPLAASREVAVVVLPYQVDDVVGVHEHIPPRFHWADPEGLLPVLSQSDVTVYKLKQCLQDPMHGSDAGDDDGVYMGMVAARLCWCWCQGKL